MKVKNITELFNAVVTDFHINQGTSVILDYSLANNHSSYEVKIKENTEIISKGMIEKFIGSTIIYAEIVSYENVTIFHIFTNNGSVMFQWCETCDNSIRKKVIYYENAAKN